MRKFIFLWLCAAFVLSAGCRSDAKRRIISDTDTTFSSDIRSISKKINASPENAELYYKRSNTFYNEMNYPQALTDIDYAIELDSLNPLYYYIKGECLMAGDTLDSKSAIKAYGKAISLRPDYTEAILKLGILQLARQQYKDADLLFRKLVELNGSDVNGYFYLGLSAKEQKDTARAKTLFEKVLQLDNNYYNAYMQLGNYYAERNDPLAIKYFDNAIRVNEYSDEAHYAKGLYLQRQNLFKDAMAMYEKTVLLNPGHRLAYYNSAYINSYFGNYDKAIELLDKTIEMSPDYADAYALRGFIYEKTGRMAEARESYQQCLKLDPDNALVPKAFH